MQIGSKKLKTIEQAMKYLAEHKEATIEEIADYLKKDYSTALRILNKILLKNRLVKAVREEPTSAKGKPKLFYSLSLYGLEYYLSINQAFSNIRDIAKAHSEMSVVFKKWDKFVENNCEGALILNLKEELKMANYTNYVMLPYLFGSGAFNFEHSKSKEATLGFTSAVLGFHYLTGPIEHQKEILGEKWAGQLKIWDVVENDYDLRRIREDVMHFFEFECTEKLKALADWRVFFSNRKDGAHV